MLFMRLTRVRVYVRIMRYLKTMVVDFGVLSLALTPLLAFDAAFACAPLSLPYRGWGMVQLAYHRNAIAPLHTRDLQRASPAPASSPSSTSDDTGIDTAMRASI